MRDVRRRKRKRLPLELFDAIRDYLRDLLRVTPDWEKAERDQERITRILADDEEVLAILGAQYE